MVEPFGELKYAERKRSKVMPRYKNRFLGKGGFLQD
jgi:hypothetical protein